MGVYNKIIENKYANDKNWAPTYLYSDNIDKPQIKNIIFICMFKLIM